MTESTAGQVNPSGGYTGLTPGGFRRHVLQIAEEIGMPPDRIILGGDHIGPYPWRHEDAVRAVPQAAFLVSACVAAGYRKIHLDTSVPCADDPRQRDGSLPLALICRRTADLCGEAERAACKYGVAPPWYVIGSDVPTPGGGDQAAKTAPVTDGRQLFDFLSACRQAFHAAGLAAAWQRVFAVVVHTGADFSPFAIQPYNTERMQPLVAHIRQEKHLVFEAHATDFQSPDALARMVGDHCGILKVGPALTYAMREALFALADIEKKTMGRRHAPPCSGLPEVMERLMVDNPRFWRSYYRGTGAALAHQRRQAYSDRIRYYWSRPEAEAALQRLIANMRKAPPPWSLIREHLPETGNRIRDGRLANDPVSIVLDRISAVTSIYARACRPDIA